MRLDLSADATAAATAAATVGGQCAKKNHGQYGARAKEPCSWATQRQSRDWSGIGPGIGPGLV